MRVALGCNQPWIASAQRSGVGARPRPSPARHVCILAGAGQLPEHFRIFRIHDMGRPQSIRGNAYGHVHAREQRDDVFDGNIVSIYNHSMTAQCVYQSVGSAEGLIDCANLVVGLDSPAWVCDACNVREYPVGNRIKPTVTEARPESLPPSARQVEWTERRRRRGAGTGANNANTARHPTNAVCKWKGEQTGKVRCPSCRGNVMVKIFQCQKHDRATLTKAVAGIACCTTCDDFATPKAANDGERT